MNVKTSTCYGEPFNGFPFLPLFGIDFTAHIVLLKSVLGLLFITIYLPASNAFVVERFVQNKALNIFRRVTEKQADLMFKFCLGLKFFDKMSQIFVWA